MRAVLVAAVLVVLGGVARADTVDEQVAKLTTGADYKQRLSAAALLAKEGDQRAIGAFIEALLGDEEKTVRGAAAVGLGKVVTEATSAEDRQRALDALKRATKDKDSFVKKQAKKAYAKLKKLEAVAVVSASDIYVELGPMTSHLGSATPSDADLSAAMAKSVEHALHRNASSWLTELPADADATKLHGYYLDGEVSELQTQQKGNGTVVACKVSMEIATYPDKKAVGNLSGGAKTSPINAAADIVAATYDCIDAVIEDFVMKKIVPVIEKATGSSPSVSAAAIEESKPSAAAATISAPAADDPGWSPDGWTLLGEDDVDLIDDEVDVNRDKSTWREVAIVVTGDEVQLDAVELGLAGKGHKLQHEDIAQTFGADSQPRIIELSGKRRAIDKVRLSYTKHSLDAQTRVQLWAR